jgi:hypothetical protein
MGSACLSPHLKKGLPHETRLPEELPIIWSSASFAIASIDWRARPFSGSCVVPEPFLVEIDTRMASVLASVTRD